MVVNIGRYEVVRRLGMGGMGSLYLARDPDVDRLVAIKVLPADPGDDELRERFVREASELARLRHPNIVAVFEVGEHAGHPFLAMEYMAGNTLTTLLRQKPSPPLVERLSLMEQLCAGLAHAHAAAIVHGDIKPANLFVSDDRVLKISDFGLARLRSATTPAGTIMGSVNYMAPEQLVGDPIDRSTDVFAAGAVLYETIALEQAFPGSIDSGLLNRILHEGPVPLTQIVPDVDPALVRIVDRSLDRTRANRYQDAEEMRRDIAQVRRLLVDVGERERRIEEALSVARRAFEHDAYDAALGASHEALALNPDLSEALALQRLVKSRLDAQRAADAAAGVTSVERRPVSLDEVQFTVYRPRTVRPRRPYQMLVFTHLGERPDAPRWTPTPIEQVRDRARRTLGPAADVFRDTTTDAKLGVPREGEITLVPQVPGVDFTPERHVFRWVDDVHEHAFELEASSALNGRVARGRLTAYLGVLLLAEVDLSIQVDSALRAYDTAERSEPVSAKPYRKIFASYSRRDSEVVRQFERYVEALGDSYLRDLRNLRAGENWQEGLLRLIDDADVFQLFWSWNAMRSPNVRREWEYALSLNRPLFIRPTYWETPLPESSAEGLPPERLRQLHFHRLGLPESLEREETPSSGRSTDDDTARLRRDELERALKRASVPEAHDLTLRGEAPAPAPARPRRSPLTRTAYLATAASVMFAAAVGMLVLRGGPPAEIAPAPVPPPKYAPAPPPPAGLETGSKLDADRAAIRRLLDQYIEAYRQKDEAGIREIDPAFTSNPPLSQWKSIEVTLSEVTIDIAPDAEAAVVRARQEFSGVTLSTGEPVSSTSELHWLLRKVGTTWSVLP